MLVGEDVADEADHFFQMYRMRLLDQHARSWRGARSRRVAAASRSGSTAMKTPRDIADRSRELARLFASWRATAFCARPSRSLSMTHARRLQNSERISGRRLHDCRGEPGASFPTARSNSRCGGCRRRIESRGKRRLTFATSISFDSASPILMNGDFCALLEAVQRRGVHVTVISSLRSKPPMIADELQRQANTFIDLEDLKAAIGRTLEAVAPRNARS